MMVSGRERLHIRLHRILKTKAGLQIPPGRFVKEFPALAGRENLPGVIRRLAAADDRPDCPPTGLGLFRTVHPGPHHPGLVGSSSSVGFDVAFRAFRSCCDFSMT